VNPYTIYMVSKTLIAAHISTLHTTLVTHMQDPLFEFHDVLARTCRLLWTLPLTAPWYHDFMVTGDSGADGERFHILRAGTMVSRELLLWE